MIFCNEYNTIIPPIIPSPSAVCFGREYIGTIQGDNFICEHSISGKEYINVLENSFFVNNLKYYKTTLVCYNLVSKPSTYMQGYMFLCGLLLTNVIKSGKVRLLYDRKKYDLFYFL